MDAGRVYSAVYVLMAKEAGSRQAIEEWLEERAMEWDLTQARTQPNVPESVAGQMRDLMAMTAPAPRRT